MSIAGNALQAGTLSFGALGANSTMVGVSSRASSTEIVAIGNAVDARSSGSVVIGQGADNTGGSDCVVIGRNAGNGSTAGNVIIGADSRMGGAGQAIIIGSGISLGIALSRLITIGTGVQTESIAIGYGVNAGSGSATSNVMIGNDTVAIGQNNVVIGHSAQLNTGQALAVIVGSNSTASLGNDTVILGTSSFIGSTASGGSRNIVLGNGSSLNGTGLDDNIILGSGSTLASGDDNIIIGHGLSPANGSNRLFFPSTIGTVTGTAVEFDGAGQMGPMASSKRFKENIEEMELDASKIHDLNPVSFDWKDKDKNEKRRDFGLIAEEVEEVIPDLVVHDEEGPFSVRYNLLAVLLLKEVQELKKKVQELEAKLA